MRKDIFIDNNIANNFSNPLEASYKKLVRWLMKYDPKNSEDNGYLAVSNKLIAEYSRTSGQARSGTNISAIVQKMTREGRLVKISNREIKEFKRKHFKKRIRSLLTCNSADRDHIPVVLLSDRRYALSLDKAFLNDLHKIPGFSPLTAQRPENIPYDQ